jgi:predicted MFS family arabinose efflux permease
MHAVLHAADHTDTTPDSAWYPTRAAGRCTLASGLAVGSSPVFLGALADAVGLRTAVLLTPALLALLLVTLAWIGRRARPGWRRGPACG